MSNTPIYDQLLTEQFKAALDREVAVLDTSRPSMWARMKAWVAQW